MIRYVIEKEPGKWLPNPEEVTDDPTDDITKAWLFDGREIAGKVLESLQEEGCLKEWIVQDHTFLEVSTVFKWVNYEPQPEIITIANLFRTYFRAPVTFR